MTTSISNLSIKAISSVVPQNLISLLDFSNLFGENEVQKIIKTTGISSIRIADEKTTSLDLSFLAAKKLLDSLSIDYSTIDGLVFVSQTLDYILPQSSHILHHKLGLQKKCICFDLPLGCSGYIHGILQASLLIQSLGCKRVLLLAGDVISRKINKRDRSLRMVFGDAATATLIESGNDTINFIVESDGSGASKLIIPYGGFRNKSTEYSSISHEREDGNWRSDDDLYMDGMGILNFAIKEVPPLVSNLLNQSNWSKESVGTYAFHQANKFMIDYLRKKIKLEEEQVPIVVDGYGNTGPATIPLLFTEYGDQARQVGKLQRVVCIGFGVGLSWAGFTCNLNETLFLKPIIYEPEI